MRWRAAEGFRNYDGAGLKTLVLCALLACSGIGLAQEAGGDEAQAPAAETPTAPAAQPPAAAAPAGQMPSAGRIAQAQPPAADETSVSSGITTAREPGNPRVAVADLAYEEKVRDYFFQYNRNTDASHKSAANSQSGDHRADFSNQYSNTESVAEGVTERMERAELRKFTADIKGELIKTNRFRVTQAKPWTQNDSPTVFDVIERVKTGYFPKADLVLFGVISQVDFRTETNPIQGSRSLSQGLYLDLVVDFSLIDTRTNEVVAAFSASGSGQDVRLGATPASFNRAKVVQEASQDLGRNVAEQIVAQTSR